jgi:hypothetical protein
MRTLLYVIPVALAACAAPALAVTEGVTSQGRPFVTGGITTDERDSLSAARPERGVRIVTVARDGGLYLADARIAIADDSGREVLVTRLDGPWLDVVLAPGRYVIDAEFERQSLSQPLVVGDARRDVYFAFDADANAIPGG